MDKDFTMNIVMPYNHTSCLENEIALLRSSLLYSDHVIINSSELNTLVEAYNKYGDDYKEEYVEEQNALIKTFEEVIDKNPDKTVNIKGAEIRGFDLFSAFIDEIQQEIDTIEKKDKNFKRLLPYILSGDIKLQRYEDASPVNEAGVVEIDPDETDERYIAHLLADAVDYEYYTLFDGYLYEVVTNEMQKIVKLYNASKYKHAGFVNQIIPTLPNFEQAEIGEILDIKKELEKPLERFRRKIYVFADEISALPWEKDFNESCKYIYQTTIKDSLDEIEEISKSTSILKNIAANFSQLNVLELAGGITASVLAGEYWAIMASLITATKVSKEVFDYYERVKKAKKNHMYFYYAAGRKLSKK